MLSEQEKLEQYEEGSDSDADAFAIIMVIVIIGLTFVHYLNGKSAFPDPLDTDPHKAGYLAGLVVSALPARLLSPTSTPPILRKIQGTVWLIHINAGFFLNFYTGPTLITNVGERHDLHYLRCNGSGRHRRHHPDTGWYCHT